MNSLAITALAIVLSVGRVSAQTAFSQTVQQPLTNVTLEGTLSLPANASKPVPAVLIIAGSGPTDRDGNSKPAISGDSYKLLADSLNARGIAVLRYDKFGAGKSRPADMSTFKEANLTFDSAIQDAAGWVKQLKADKRFSKIIIAGHSEGSLVGMIAAQQTNADGFISIAGPGRNIAETLKEQLKTLPDEMRQTAYKDLDSLRSGQFVKKPPVMLMSLFRPSVQPYMISWMKYDPAVEINKIKAPVLVIQGKRDLQVQMLEAETLTTARPNAKTAYFDRMTHMLKDTDSDDQAANMKTYKDPSLPLTTGLVPSIAGFIKSL
nr:alpha/beta fold hydrolase [uncultured Arsenicibacter sp.]